MNYKRKKDSDHFLYRETFKKQLFI